MEPNTKEHKLFPLMVDVMDFIDKRLDPKDGPEQYVNALAYISMGIITRNLTLCETPVEINNMADLMIDYSQKMISDCADKIIKSSCN